MMNKEGGGGGGGRSEWMNECMKLHKSRNKIYTMIVIIV